MIYSSALKISLLAIFIYMVLDNYYYKDASDCPSTGYYLARHHTILGCPDDRVLSVQGGKVEVVKRRWQDSMEAAVSVGSWECKENGSVLFEWKNGQGLEQVSGYFIENGDKLILTTKGQTGWEINMIEREEANHLKRKDPVDNIPSQYEKKPPGKLVILTGVAGSGKSSIAKWLQVNAGFVSYDNDAFYCGANPYITGLFAPKDNIPLVGEGMGQRLKTYSDEKLRGLHEQTFLEFSREIKRERNRLGGDWVIFGIFLPDEIESLQTFLGEEITTVLLRLDSKMQEKRLVARHGNNDSGFVKWALLTGESFHSVWASEKVKNIFQNERSTIEENTEKVLNIINSY